MTSDHLKDETTYKMVEANFDAEVVKGVAKIIEKFKGKLTKMKKNILQVSHIPQVISMASNESILPFITTFNPNNPNIYSTIKSSVNCLKNNNVSGFHNIKLIQSKRQSPNLKKLLIKAEFGKVLSGMFNCSNKTCECCNYLGINDHYTFKNVQISFKLKNQFTCDKSNLICVVFCDTCKDEYVGEIEKGKTKLRDRVRIYREHIWQSQYQQLKVEGHLRVCGNGKLQIFS